MRKHLPPWALSTSRAALTVTSVVCSSPRMRILRVFVCLSLKLIVEVDGKDHFTEAGRRADAQRDQFLRDQGFEVFRVDGYQVTQDPTSVRRLIEEAVDKQIELE